MPFLADVAVPVPLAQAFTYAVPPSLADVLRPGARVVCEFGRRHVLGVVLAISEREPPPGAQIKPIHAIIDAEPILPRELLNFLQELSAYYFAPIGEVLRIALPALEREQVKAMSAQGELPAMTRVKQVGGKKILFARPTDAIEAPGKLRGQAAAVLALLRANGEQPVAHLAKQFSTARTVIKKLADLGLVETEEREAPRDPFFAVAEARDEPPELNEAQAEAASRIVASLEAIEDRPAEGKAVEGKPPTSFLLFGVTGSGKTEVYLRAIEACLARGRGALVMVPEIALTPQLVARFRARFGDELAVLHSALSDADRHAMWSSLRQGRVRVAIGARSALFAPVPDLGLIIVDEEHDSSFKQEEGVRYHARDMALLRAYRARAVAVLGSATPSLESVMLARKGRLEELRLPERAHREATLPAVTLVDIRRIGAGPTGSRLVSIPLHRALEATLAAGEQAILFLNRRGFAPSVVCDTCGAVETCRACSVALTYHRGRMRAPESEEEVLRGGRLRCHYCDFEGPLPEGCSGCGSVALMLEGLGTERLEAIVGEAFPSARIARLDRDVANASKSQSILDRMRAGEIDILVGTQMVTKGHDLPNVTLVGVVNADAALSLPDFRAAERGFQLLVQVAGRAGRRDRPGRVLIQTRAPDHPAVAFASKHDVLGFLERELMDRCEVGYPPFTRLGLVRIDAADEDLARSTAAKIARDVKASPEVRAKRVVVLGPAAAPIARLRGRFRFRVLLRAEERGPLRIALAIAARARDEADRRARVVIDVDPVAML
jgi:primosomal protein N' (replication factor Y)